MNRYHQTNSILHTHETRNLWTSEKIKSNRIPTSNLIDRRVAAHKVNGPPNGKAMETNSTVYLKRIRQKRYFKQMISPSRLQSSLLKRNGERMDDLYRIFAGCKICTYIPKHFVF